MDKNQILKVFAEQNHPKMGTADCEHLQQFNYQNGIGKLCTHVLLSQISLQCSFRAKNR
jgi:hypothetical protein